MENADTDHTINTALLPRFKTINLVSLVSCLDVSDDIEVTHSECWERYIVFQKNKMNESSGISWINGSLPNLVEQGVSKCEGSRFIYLPLLWIILSRTMQPVNKMVIDTKVSVY